MLIFSAGCLEHGNAGSAHLQTPSQMPQGAHTQTGEGVGRGQRSRVGGGPGACSPRGGGPGDTVSRVVRRPHRASGSWGVWWSGHPQLLQVQ